MRPRPFGLSLILASAWLLSAPISTAEGLWDRVKSGAEKGGAVLQEGVGQGLDLGGSLTKRGLEAGKGAIEDTLGHFYRDGTPDEVRARVDQMAFDTLDRLFAQDPEAHLLFDHGHGYAVFEVRQVSLTVVAGYGYGVAVAHDGNQRIYMKLAAGGLEVSKGTSGFVSRWVVLFEDASAFAAFVSEGFDASAEVSGTLGSEGAAFATRYRQGVAVYRVTEGGLRLAAGLSGTRFWPDDWLNGTETPVEVVSGPDLAVPPTQGIMSSGPAPGGLGVPPDGAPTPGDRDDSGAAD